MATVKLTPSTLSNSNTQLTISNSDNALTDVSSSNYATITNTTSSTSNRYIYLKGFNFSSVPDTATINSFTIRIKGYYTSGYSQAMSVCNGTTAISGPSATSFTTSVQTREFSNGSMTWATMKGYGENFGIRVNCRRSNRNTKATYYIYGAEIEVDYTPAGPVAVTGVSLDHNSASIDLGDTLQLTETVTPANATDKSVTWSSSNTAVATVDSSGLVTAVSVGNATITVTTTDGGYTDTCAVAVSPVTYVDYVQTDTLVNGKEYIIADGTSGTVHVLTNVSGGTGILQGITATASSGRISISSGNANKAKFTVALETVGDSTTTLLVDANSKYLYTDSSNHLRVDSWTSSMASKHWHYKGESKHLLWFFKDSAGNDGYEDTSSTYKYYLEVTGGNFTDNHVTSPALADTTTPAMYIFAKDEGGGNPILYQKDTNGWDVQVQKVWLKVDSSTWVEQASSSWSTLFSTSKNYRKMN